MCQGKPCTKESFKRLCRTLRTRVGLGPRKFTFHDMRAKAGSDAESDLAAQELLHHASPKITKRVYRRKVPSSIPLPSTVKGRNAA